MSLQYSSNSHPPHGMRLKPRWGLQWVLTKFRHFWPLDQLRKLLFAFYPKWIMKVVIPGTKLVKKRKSYKRPKWKILFLCERSSRPSWLNLVWTTPKSRATHFCPHNYHYPTNISGQVYVLILWFWSHVWLKIRVKNVNYTEILSVRSDLS